MRRVVITGMGMITPLGYGVETNWNAILSSRSGLTKIKEFDISDLPCQIAGRIPLSDDRENAVDLDDLLAAKERRKLDDFVSYGIIAANQALADSGWVADDEDKAYRTGVMIGSGIGGLSTIYEASILLNERGPRRISPFFIPSSLINLISGQVSIRHNLKGPNHAVVTACSTGAHAIGDASRLIKYGDADVMVAGGAEAAVCRLGLAGFSALKALSSGYNDTPEKASRPWDNGRDGFVMGEGAGVLVLEEYEHAKARGAKIYAEVKGYGLSGDAYHITAPAADGDGGYRSMSAALRNAELNIDQIDYINAHGTSTPMGDMIELNAVSKLYHGDKSNINMSSTKSATGHLLGAAGAIEAIYSVLAVRDGKLPPTLNLDDPSDDIGDINLVPHEAQDKPVRNALSNSFGFGGTNASLIVGQPD
ncbi:MAG: beta-ketoacyl-ACP synthase II [Alphaproteobacteria bacterium]|nr:beta-ketoacyl-ACP synthase II [Alphaproteobacteria bacterium]MDA8675845.1 beta-ketoacyl-ACP synthase II [Alphaproteobacteria bacterium]MDG2467067.1 beta-ketoacyl-ACP synthase II [Alphaproteobacteria bacterium]